jgi:hypothetical protein
VTAFPGFWRPLLGGIIWIAAALWMRPSPFDPAWAILLLLLAPLVLVPLGLRLANRAPEDASVSFLLRLATTLQLPAAVLLVLAFALPPGEFAASLSLPWLLMTGLVSLAGLLRIRKRGLVPWEELCLDAGLVYLVVGGGWAVLSRWGMRPLEFEAIIVLLTAIHFHYAGFVLPLLTGLAVRNLKDVWGRWAALGAAAGVPLVAVGITATQLGFGTALESFAACLTALAGIGTAALHLRLSLDPARPRLARLLWLTASLALGFSMLLAALYGCRFFLPMERLDIPWMRAWHGTANALGFGLGGLLAWTRVVRQD